MQVPYIQQDVITWNALTISYAHNEYVDDALKLTTQMKLAVVKSDVITHNGRTAGYSSNQ
jgi:pentatricopeptide repeat protein